MSTQSGLQTRRSFLRLAGAAGLVVAGGLVLPDAASAGITWCRTDPVLNVDGVRFRIWVSSTEAMYNKRTSAISVRVACQQVNSVRLETVPGDNGFGLGYGLSSSTSVSSGGGARSVQIAVRAPSSDSSLPVLVELEPLSSGYSWQSVQGTSNQWLNLSRLTLR